MSVIGLLKNKLSQIATEQNGEFFHEDQTANFTDGSRCPESYYQVNYSYKESYIEIYVETGLVQLTRIVCTLSPNLKPIEFKIESVSQFVNLFLRNNSRFKIECENDNFKKFLKNKALLVFKKTMDSKNFDPTIYTTMKNSENLIILESHLKFPKWVEIFDEINEFIKLLISQIETVNS